MRLNGESVAETWTHTNGSRCVLCELCFRVFQHATIIFSVTGKCVLLSGLDGVIRLLAKETGELFNTYKG